MENKKTEMVQNKSNNDIDLIRLTELSELIKLKPSTIFKAIRKNKIPKPMKLLGRINVWDKSEIIAWLHSQRQI
jgi:predicted DNA-binding transcriptional regulator AlpA